MTNSLQQFGIGIRAGPRFTLLIISLGSELVTAVERSLSRRYALVLLGPIRTFDPWNLSWPRLGPTAQGAQGQVCRARARALSARLNNCSLRLWPVCTMRHTRPARHRGFTRRSRFRCCSNSDPDWTGKRNCCPLASAALLNDENRDN